MKKDLFFILFSTAFFLASCGSKTENQGANNTENDSVSVPQENVRPTGDLRSVPDTPIRDTINSDSIIQVK